MLFLKWLPMILITSKQCKACVSQVIIFDAQIFLMYRSDTFKQGLADVFCTFTNQQVCNYKWSGPQQVYQPSRPTASVLQYSKLSGPPNTFFSTYMCMYVVHTLIYKISKNVIEVSFLKRFFAVFWVGILFELSVSLSM